jgi:heme-degrading monooxygenase HmoA
MPYMLVHHQVSDFAKWKPFFDKDESTRKTSGSKSAQVFQNSENPSDVFILFEWDTVENAKKFGMSDDLKKTMEQAGVIGRPHIHFLKEVQKSKA